MTIPWQGGPFTAYWHIEFRGSKRERKRADNLLVRKAVDLVATYEVGLEPNSDFGYHDRFPGATHWSIPLQSEVADELRIVNEGLAEFLMWLREEIELNQIKIKLAASCNSDHRGTIPSDYREGGKYGTPYW